MDAVDTSALKKTVEHLATALEQYREHQLEEMSDTLRSGVVQNFATCWQQVRPTLERLLSEVDGLGRDTVKEMNLGRLLKTANDRGYTGVEWERWKAFYEARNKIAHAYYEPFAVEVVNLAPELVQTVQEILEAAERKQTDV